ncbi:MAG: RnfABCDGE type electron transport complex subunit D [Elusimicrobia bacterium]|nr:RnfABCDGE type electron transport complex subunit D [Elusimicrobiota bacterium]
MKLVSGFTKGLVVHAFSQVTYIIISFSFFVLKRPPYWWLTLVAVNAFYYGLHLHFIRKKTKVYTLWPVVGIGISNSVFINLEGHNLWVYLLAGFIGVTAMTIFSDNRQRHPSDRRGKHAFNPSALGILAVIMLFPSAASTGTWAELPWLQALILLLGTTTVLVNRRWCLSYSYLLGFALCSVPYWALCRFGGLADAHDLSVLFWPSVMTAPSTLIWAFHVISDPVTSPDGKKGQVWFGLATGAVDFVLRGVLHSMQADVIAYIFVQAVYWYWTQRAVAAPEAQLVAAPSLGRA